MNAPADRAADDRPTDAPAPTRPLSGPIGCSPTRPPNTAGSNASRPPGSVWPTRPGMRRTGPCTSRTPTAGTSCTAGTWPPMCTPCHRTVGRHLARDAVGRRRDALVVRRHRRRRVRLVEPATVRRRPRFGRPGPAHGGPGYPAGLEVVDGWCWPASPTMPAPASISRSRVAEPAVVYRNTNDGSVDGLSRDETIWLLAHSEHGDSRYPALRAISVGNGDLLAELDDTPGRGLGAIAFSPIPGDQRVLVGHERHGHDQLLIWDPLTGVVENWRSTCPGTSPATSSRTHRSLLVLHTHAARTTLHRYDLESGALTDLPAAAGVVAGAGPRPDARSGTAGPVPPSRPSSGCWPAAPTEHCCCRRAARHRVLNR